MILKAQTVNDLSETWELNLNSSYKHQLNLQEDTLNLDISKVFKIHLNWHVVKLHL